ncbi:hypothetical protein QCA50_009793 [Cerrena zonata]|uniref:Efficient mitochondria targeting-associated protein 19 n=1 Tax=Cerrena zonata TaxID=2478898 RepID=A0AAW0GBH3_9APHY
MAPRPLLTRPLDLLYFVFFVIHIPNTLLVDLQALYPSHILPTFIANLPKLYVNMSSDPLIGGAMGYFGIPQNYVWFKSFLFLEMFFQLPVFFLGVRGLWKDCRSIYVLLLVYGASTTTTLFPCLAVLLNTPITSSETIAAKAISITSEQRTLLLSSYIPFLLIPLTLTIDMAFRILRLTQAGVAAEARTKNR